MLFQAFSGRLTWRTPTVYGSFEPLTQARSHDSHDHAQQIPLHHRCHRYRSACPDRGRGLLIVVPLHGRVNVRGQGDARHLLGPRLRPGQIEASKNNPNWGLLWVDGATAFAGLGQQGLLQKGFEPKVAWNSLGQQSLPADKSYTPTGVTLMAALVYNKTKVTAGMMDYLGGVSKGENYFTSLKSNGLIIHPTNGPTLQALTSGQIKLALVQSSAGIGAVLGDKQLAVKYLDPVTLLPSALGIDAKAPAAERAEAEKFIEFVLSPAGQKVMQSGDPIDLPGSGRLTGVFAETRAARGEPVGLRLEPGGCHVFTA